MWLLSWLPDNIIVILVNTVLILGIVLTVVSTVLKIVPFINIYRLPLQIAGVVLILIGVWFHGGWAVEAQWRERVRLLEEQVFASEARSAELNEQLGKEIAKKRAARRQLAEATRQNIEQRRDEINAECRLNSTAVEAYNEAVRGRSK